MKLIIKSFAWVAFYFIFQFIVQIIFSSISIFFKLTNIENINNFAINNLLLLSIISNFLFLIIIMIKYKKINSQNDKSSLTISILSCSITLSFSFIFAIITANITFITSSQIAESFSYYNKICSNLGFILEFVSLLVIAPITEEILCRGILFNILKQKFSCPISIIISSLIFGLMHILAGGIILAVSATILGILLCLIYQTTKSMKLTILAHSVANLPDFLFIGVDKISFGLQLSIIIISMTILCLSLYFFFKKAKQ